MNDTTKKIRDKGYLLGEFLLLINRSERWYRSHSHPLAKHYVFLIMAIDGLPYCEVSKASKTRAGKE